MLGRRTKWTLPVVIWFVGSISISSAETGSASLAEEVSNARAAVDSLSERLESQRRSVRESLSALQAERAELERQVRLEQIRQDTLTQIRAERIKRVDEQEGRLLTLLKPIKRSLKSAQKYVSVTLPFKQEERMLHLKKIEADLAVTHPDPGNALTRLWRFIEEEEAMAREIALGQQAIELDGKRLLVEVARIGMALMYFRLPGGDVGWVRQAQEGWLFERLTSPASQKTVLKIFGDLENNRALGPKRLLITSELPPATAGKRR